MGSLQAWLARTSPDAAFPLMVHESMVTEPPWTKTPPPCKQGAKCDLSLPLGRWEILSVAGIYKCSILVVQGSTHHKSEKRNEHVNRAFSHRGDGKFSAACTHPLEPYPAEAVLPVIEEDVIETVPEET
jgi:hypothetical protein